MWVIMSTLYLLILLSQTVERGKVFDFTPQQICLQNISKHSMPRCAGLPPAAQRSQQKDVPGENHWAPLCYLASGGSKISTKDVPG